MATKRTTHRSSKGTKFYALRDKAGKVKINKGHTPDRFV